MVTQLSDTVNPTKSLRRYLASGIGLSQITEANLGEVWARVFILESVLGTHDLEPALTFGDVRKNVGLSVADADKFGSAELMKRVGNRLRERAYRLQRRSAESAEKAAQEQTGRDARGSRAYRAGHADGLAWDLDGFASRDEVERGKSCWDEATINAIGTTAFAMRVECTTDGPAWQNACDDYNAGVLAGALAPQSTRTGLAPGRVRS